MPLYEYRCKSCSREFDLLRPMEFSDKSADCPSCSKPAMRKLSVFASISKGGSSRGESSGGESASEGASGPACDSGGGACCGGGACGTMN